MASPQLLTALFLLAAALMVPTPAYACVGTKVSVSKDYAKPAQKIAENAWDQSGVQQHFDALAAVEDFRPDLNTTFACIDSRGQNNILGTPGGDTAELIGGIQAYMNLTKTTKVTPSEVQDIFNAFMDQVATGQRPFYYHTSDEKLQSAFKYLEGHVHPMPTVLPSMMPSDPKDADKWLAALSMSKTQGCGHLRLMLDKYPEYGLHSPDIPKDVIKAFYRYFWGTPVGSVQRRKIHLAFKQGVLGGNAIAVIHSTGSCPGYSPALPPSHCGSQTFIYHAQAVEDFRANVLVPFFINYASKHGHILTQKEFAAKLQNIQAMHLASTLKYLAPANSLPLWTVTITASNSTPHVADGQATHFGKKH